MKQQSGTTTLEFAIIAGLVFMVLFGVIEIARAFFVWNTLNEVTRRGARIAAVCAPNDQAIKQAAIFTPPGSDSNSVLVGLTPDNIHIEYLDQNGNPAPPYYYTRVSIINFQHTFFIPFLTNTVTTPEFSTTVPVESLGYNPDNGIRECVF